MRKSSLLLLTAVLVSITVVAAQNSGSGSGSGSGVLTCRQLDCSHGCNETSMGPMCYCPTGYELGDDELTCQVCRGGYWGVGCSMMCSCGPGASGNPCDNINGSCICNSCWSGTTCETSVSSDCLLEFFQEPDKDANILRQRYGGVSFPTPDSDTIGGLILDDLLETTSAIVADPILATVSRADVGQGDLARLTFTVNFDVNRPEAEAALARLDDKVKLGDLRVTLIQQILTNTAEITINAGTYET